MKSLILWLVLQQILNTDGTSDSARVSSKKTSLLSNNLDRTDRVPTDCRDEYDQCKTWARAGYCDAFSAKVRPICRRSCPHACDDGSIELGEAQVHGNKEDVRSAVALTLDYLHSEVNDNPEYDFVRDKCINAHENCAYWSTIGECESNPKGMLYNCCASCRNCFDLDVMLRCPWDPTAPLAMDTGGINEMFERITDPKSKWSKMYDINILSRPTETDDEEEDGGPWIITLDGFLNDTECDALIEMGSFRGYERSTAQSGDSSETGLFVSEVTDYRTSQQTWCHDECYENPITRAITDRIGNLTGIPEQYSEHLQLLKYEEGQYYYDHHDFIDMQNERPMGPRLLTVFMYLNDEGLEGGGTRFTRLDLTVMPKKGRVLIWPSVINDDLMEFDDRTYHEALAVEKGFKYGANAWYHLGDFKDADDRDCVF